MLLVEQATKCCSPPSQEIKSYQQFRPIVPDIQARRLNRKIKPNQSFFDHQELWKGSYGARCIAYMCDSQAQSYSRVFTPFCAGYPWKYKNLGAELRALGPPM